MLATFKKAINLLIVNPRRRGIGDPARILDENFGAGRGTPLDRQLIENFVRNYSKFDSREIFCLEFGDSILTGKYFPLGKRILFTHVSNQEMKFTSEKVLEGDLLVDQTYSGQKFDFIIATQLLAFTENPFKAAENLLSLLKPNGIIIGTEPFCSPLSNYDDSRWGDFFRFTEKGITSVYSSVGKDKISIDTFPLGNWSTTYGLFKGHCEEDNLSIDKNPDARTTSNIGYEVVFKDQL